MPGTAATLLGAPMQKGFVQKDACVQHSLEPGAFPPSPRAGPAAMTLPASPTPNILHQKVNKSLSCVSFAKTENFKGTVENTSSAQASLPGKWGVRSVLQEEVHNYCTSRYWKTKFPGMLQIKSEFPSLGFKTAHSLHSRAHLKDKMRQYLRWRRQIKVRRGKTLRGHFKQFLLHPKQHKTLAKRSPQC